MLSLTRLASIRKAGTVVEFNFDMVSLLLLDKCPPWLKMDRLIDSKCQTFIVFWSWCWPFTSLKSANFYVTAGKYCESWDPTCHFPNSCLAALGSFYRERRNLLHPPLFFLIADIGSSFFCWRSSRTRATTCRGSPSAWSRISCWIAPASTEPLRTAMRRRPSVIHSFVSGGEIKLFCQCIFLSRPSQPKSTGRRKPKASSSSHI